MSQPLHFNTQILEKLRAARPDEVLSIEESAHQPAAIVVSAHIAALVTFLKESPDFAVDYLSSITALHHPASDDGANDRFTVVYHLYSIANNTALALKAELDGANTPRIPTIDRLFHSANWFEREVYDLFGIVFDGSRDLRRIMLPQDWRGHPLRKDYVEESEYNGMPTSRRDLLEEARPV